MMYSIKMRASQHAEHISGAETICRKEEIESTLQKFMRKGFFHENGEPDFMNFKVEQITKPLITLEALQIIGNQTQSATLASQGCGISVQALTEAWKYIQNEVNYRGAVIIDAASGKRLDDTNDRGIRVTNFMMDQSASNGLNERVQDALAIATCINAYPGVAGELCVSDDLNYTTGYFASQAKGYCRLYQVKEVGSRNGGRVIFVEEAIDLNNYRRFLEQEPKCIVSKN